MIGQAEANKKSRDWTLGMAAYDQVLAKLSNISSAHDKPRERRKRKDCDTEDSAAVIQEAGMAAANAEAPQSGKISKKKKKGSSADRGVVTNGAAAASVEEAPAISESEVIKGSSKSRHSARFARRRAGKNVRG